MNSTFTRIKILKLFIVVMLVSLAGCGGSGSQDEGARASPNQLTDSPVDTSTLTADDGSVAVSVQTEEALAQHFAKHVQPQLDFCRTCHVPGGIANVDGGRDFVLSSDKQQDFVNVKASWEQLGRNNPVSRILSMASGQIAAHTGGTPWSVGSAPYKNVQILFACFDDAVNCAELLAGTEEAANPLPVLGSSHARSFMASYCEGEPDSAELPQDPRELIRPGVNQGKAVAFNAYWEDCTSAGNNPWTKPKTCGEYRSRLQAGEELIRTGLAATVGNMGAIPASRWNRLWRRWGLKERPADYDIQLRDRYGLPKAPFNNPYPLKGEDPKTSNGGSGQLPLGLVQIRNEQGEYTGTISITCDICHSGELQMLPNGEHFVSGMGANTADMQLLISDVSFPVPFGLNASRGVTNAEGLSGLLIGMLDLDSLGLRPEGVLLSQIPGNTTGAGDTKMPAWWNASHRPRKFWDAGLSYDAARLDSAILNIGIPIMSPLGSNKMFNQQLREKIERESYLIQTYVESLEAPVWPGTVDTALAQQGAILFHAKDLWTSGTNADIPRPPSNGSCAGCHGAYSPRYVNDPAYLEDPRLEGIAGYIAPPEQIRTDKGRVRGFTRTLLENISSSWFSYPESKPGYVAPENKTVLDERFDDLKAYRRTRIKGACTWQGIDEDDVVGYLAPPLYGIWATAPYFHNASVPDLWGVLDPDSRPAVWRRQLTQGPGREHGYDTASNAYDADRLGWKYDKLTCAEDGGTAYVSCDPEQAPPVLTNLVEFLRTFPASINTLGYQVAPPITRKSVERRKIFNSHLFGKKNTGHDFTRALNDQERRAIIEYLKTL